MKVGVLRAHNVEVQLGGITIEIVIWQKKIDEVLLNLREMGFAQIEVFSTATPHKDMSETMAKKEKSGGKNFRQLTLSRYLKSHLK